MVDEIQTTNEFYQDADDAAWRGVEKALAEGRCWACNESNGKPNKLWCPEIWPGDCRNG